MSILPSRNQEQPTVAATRLALRAAELAPRSDAERRLAPELVAAIAEAGLFGLCVPEAASGSEVPPSVLLEVVEVLSRGDAAAGWCVAVCATSGLLAGYLSEPAAQEIYAPQRTIVGGAFAPKGRAQTTESGFRVSGRWPFASGCDHCDWLMGGSVVEHQGQVQRLPNGMPDIRLMLAPAREVQIHDTWHVAGLRGTGSKDIEFCELAIPREHSASVLSDTPVQPGPLYTFPLFGLLALAIAGVGLGLGRGALEDLSALATRKTPTGSGRLLAERPTVQAELARAEASLRSARGFLHETVEHAWSVACERSEVPVQERAAIRLAATHATTVAAEVVLSAYRLGGGSSIYENNALQRRLRDVNAATQHMAVAPATWELTGRVLLGLPTDVTQL